MPGSMSCRLGVTLNSAYPLPFLMVEAANVRYAKKRDDETTDWQFDEDRVRERLVRVRRREAPMSPRVTRKMAKIDAELLALARREDPRASLMPTSPPPGRAAAVPPPLAIPFPFPFANTASTSMPSVAVTTADRSDSFIDVHDSWLLPPLPSKMPALPLIDVAAIPSAGSYRSLRPREPDPFTVVPPAFSLPPR